MAKRDFSDVLKESLAAIGSEMKRAGVEIGAEMSRLGTQGAMEMAQALFNGGAFTPYGPGQYTPTPEAGVHGPEVQKPEPGQGQERERGGRDM